MTSLLVSEWPWVVRGLKKKRLAMPYGSGLMNIHGNLRYPPQSYPPINKALLREY